MAYYKAPTSNYVSTTLNGSINDSVGTITLNDASKLQFPGVIVIDREDGNGTSTPSSREIVSYTGISGNQLTGCTRNVDSSGAKSHNDGALVEAVLTVGMWNDLRDGVAAALSTDGTGLTVSNATVSAITQTARLAVSSIASIARYEGIEAVLSSSASIAKLNVGTHLSASGASVTGFGGVGGLNAMWQVPGSLASQANVGGMVVVPAAYTANHMIAYAQTPSSIASVAGYLVKQGGTVVGMFSILGGSTYGSSASLAVTALAAGDNITMDIRSTASLAADLSVVLRAV